MTVPDQDTFTVVVPFLIEIGLSPIFSHSILVFLHYFGKAPLSSLVDPLFLFSYSKLLVAVSLSFVFIYVREILLC